MATRHFEATRIDPELVTGLRRHLEPSPRGGIFCQHNHAARFAVESENQMHRTTAKVFARRTDEA